MSRPELTPGKSETLSLRVETQDLASALSIENTDQFPPVLATSRMVAFMELAAARLMQPLLSQGELSVGVGVDIKHTAATLAGERITARADYLGMDGKLYRFRVSVSDDAGVAGDGLHTRAIVDTERLLAGAHKRVVHSKTKH